MCSATWLPVFVLHQQSLLSHNLQRFCGGYQHISFSDKFFYSNRETEKIRFCAFVYKGVFSFLRSYSYILQMCVIYSHWRSSIFLLNNQISNVLLLLADLRQNGAFFMFEPLSVTVDSFFFSTCICSISHLKSFCQKAARTDQISLYFDFVPSYLMSALPFDLQLENQ